MISHSWQLEGGRCAPCRSHLEVMGQCHQHMGHCLPWSCCS